MKCTLKVISHTELQDKTAKHAMYFPKTFSIQDMKKKKFQTKSVAYSSRYKQPSR